MQLSHSEKGNNIIYNAITQNNREIDRVHKNELYRVSKKNDATFNWYLFLLHLLIARCDIGVQLSVRSSVRLFVRPSVHNLCQGAYSVAVIAGSMKPCIVITLDTHFKKAS